MHKNGKKNNSLSDRALQQNTFNAAHDMSFQSHFYSPRKPGITPSLLLVKRIGDLRAYTLAEDKLECM